MPYDSWVFRIKTFKYKISCMERMHCNNTNMCAKFEFAAVMHAQVLQNV
jgi:putative component of membrane protein insertase Oxa1/YidC/SpoIIIJ protein YidD